MYKHRIVIESNNVQELAHKLIDELTRYTTQYSIEKPKIEIMELKEHCPLCTSPMVEKQGISKKGKPYHSKNCTACSHVEWLDK